MQNRFLLPEPLQVLLLPAQVQKESPPQGQVLLSPQEQLLLPEIFLHRAVLFLPEVLQKPLFLLQTVLFLLPSQRSPLLSLPFLHWLFLLLRMLSHSTKQNKGKNSPSKTSASYCLYSYPVLPETCFFLPGNSITNTYKVYLCRLLNKIMFLYFSAFPAFLFYYHFVINVFVFYICYQRLYYPSHIITKHVFLRSSFYSGHIPV